jgi:HAD superfamily hydrolase (TIGR01450 family)
MELAGVDTVVFDIDGVVVVGKQAVPGAGAALHRLRQAGSKVIFITNNSTKTREAVADRIEDIVGYKTKPETIITSGWATGFYIRDRVSRAYVVGSDGLRSTLLETGVGLAPDWKQADAVVVGLDFEVTYRKLVEATLAVQNGARLYATNTDASYPSGEGLYPGAGALVSVVETATGVRAIACGKPNLPMRELLDDFVAGPALMVGDRPETDIALGKAEGWATALVLTGVTTNAAEVPAEYAPDLVLESISDLPPHLGL